MRSFAPVAFALALSSSLGAWSFEADAATFTRGPYLQDLSSRSAALLFGLDAPHGAKLEVFVGAVGGEAGAPVVAPIVVQAPVDDAQELVVSGLLPATSYRWTITVDDGTKSNGSFTTAPEDDRPFGFLLYGDNRTDASSHAAIVQRMTQTPASFVVQTGDMVYDGADADLWTQFFSIEHDLLRDRCMFAAIGNHEIGLPTSDGALRFARLFRNAGPSSANERYYTFRWGSARFFMLDAQDDFASAERAWLEGALQSADSEPGLVWRFVVLHHGPFSSGLHGPNASLLLGHVPELLKAHHVDVVFSGHDHIYERGESGGLKYVVSGGGGAPLYTERRDDPSSLRFEAVHHFIALDVTKSDVTMRAIRMDGSTIERCTFGPGGAGGWGCPSANVAAPAMAQNTAPGAPPPVPPRRACDCSFSLSRVEWIGGVAVTALLLAAGVRRKTR